jgi:hypothetical protein
MLGQRSRNEVRDFGPEVGVCYLVLVRGEMRSG